MNHSFVVGDSYQDARGTYKVVSIEGNLLVYEYADGIQRTGDAEIKWRIHRNIFSEQNAPCTASSLQPSQLAHGDNCFTYEEVASIFADIIRAYGKKHKDFMTHDKIVAAFMEHPEGQLILNRPHYRANLYWAGVMKAHFSKKYNSGESEWDDCFEPKRGRKGYSYRVRQKKH